MIAGPNGAGKTTLTRWLRGRIEFGEYINPDDIAEQLEGTYDERVRQAQMIADARRDECIVARRSFSFETVMSHPSKLDILARARESGFFIQLFFIGTNDPRINIARVAVRVTQGGHDVPTDKIIARWFRTMELLSEAIRLSDRTFLFDNSNIVDDVGPGHLFGWSKSLQRDSIWLFGWRESQMDVPMEDGVDKPLPAWVRRYVPAFAKYET